MYAHPAVAETVRRLGGRSAILTGNTPADRAKFIDAFRDVIDQETGRLALPESAQLFIASRQEPAQLTARPIQKLAGLLSVGGK